MSNEVSSILKRIQNIIPSPDEIASNLQVEQGMARKIYDSMLAQQRVMAELIDYQREVTGMQESFIGHQVETQEVLAGHIDRSANVATLLRNLDVFLAGQPEAIEHVLKVVDPAIFKAAWVRLPEARQIALLGPVLEDSPVPGFR